MDIKTEQDPIGWWQAIDFNIYDCDCDQAGFFPTCPVGYGKTESDAIEDLMDQMEEARVHPL